MKWGIRNWLLHLVNWNPKNIKIFLSTDDSDSQMGQQCQAPNKTIDLNDQVSFAFLPIYP